MRLSAPKIGQRNLIAERNPSMHNTGIEPMGALNVSG
jgi:hypothetical protein